MRSVSFEKEVKEVFEVDWRKKLANLVKTKGNAFLVEFQFRSGEVTELLHLEKFEECSL